MRLEHLVPPVELCAQIPEGEFKDSIFSWVHSTVYMPPDGQGTDVLFVTWSHRDDFCLRRICPAPTLKEILSATPIGEVGIFCCYFGDGEWSIGDCEHDLYVKNGYEGKSPEESALKWWLKLKGN